jgi:putative spermidine/putrescine transport system ATP-binding protein
VEENVAFALRMKGVRRAERRARAAEALDLVRLSGYGRRVVTALSGGEKQRVALARAIVPRPALLLLDEPLGALDLQLRRSMQDELRDLQRRVGLTFLHVTHDQEEAFRLADRVAVLCAGLIAQQGPPREVYRRPASAFVASFLGVGNLWRGRVAEGGRRFVTERGLALEASEPRPGAAHAAVREERVVVSPPGPRGLRGEVVDVAFLGALTRVTVDVLGERVQGRAADGWAPKRGDAASVVVDPADVLLLPPEDAA